MEEGHGGLRESDTDVNRRRIVLVMGYLMSEGHKTGWATYVSEVRSFERHTM